jgi:hypothetical protein
MREAPPSVMDQLRLGMCECKCIWRVLTYADVC